MNGEMFTGQGLLEWFSKKKRELPWRESKDLYSVWISEVMLQQTQVATVIPFFQRFVEQFPTVYDLAAATEQAVLKVWEGMGYYSRARNLHQAAQVVVNKYNGRIPADLKSFQNLPGVGPYISAAVLSISMGIPIPVVDGNVMRVFARFKGIGSDIRKSSTRKKIYNTLAEIIPQEKPGDFNQALMELGAVVCKSREPQCPDCPLKENCYAFLKGEVERFPYKSPLPETPQYQVSVGVIVNKNRFYIQKRPSKGHLGGFWEFPGGKGKEGEAPEETLMRECGEELKGEIKIVEQLKVVRHAYTHFKIILSVFICQLVKGTLQPKHSHPFKWITIGQLKDFPFPGANHKFFPDLLGYFKNQKKGGESK